MANPLRAIAAQLQSPYDAGPSVYEELQSILNDATKHPLEIEILESRPDFGSGILYEPGAVGILRGDVLLSYLLTYRRWHELLAAYEANDATNHIPNPELHALTLIVLLLHPEYLTAANIRKSYLQAKYQENEALIADELLILRSFLTSPLPKHTKSPTLWSHRYWIISTFTSSNFPNDIDLMSQGFLKEELKVVLKSGDRHHANYHAFDYGRRFVRLAISLQSKDSEEESEESEKQEAEQSEKEESKELEKQEAVEPEQQEVEQSEKHEGVIDRETIEGVRKWCLAHPKDISGWGFLAFLLKHPGVIEEQEEERERAVNVVKTFVEDIKWEGKSVYWFLKEMGDSSNAYESLHFGRA